jgi:hypothetical protein
MNSLRRQVMPSCSKLSLRLSAPTERSALFIVWDENDFGSNLVCCGRPGVGGGHVPMIVVTKQGKPIKSATPTNHYSLLATIEDGFGLPRLANAKTAAPLFDLFFDSE